MRVQIPAVLSTYPAEHGQMPEVQRAAVSLLNLVIDHYRHVVGAPQIRRLAGIHSRGFV